MRPTEAFVSFLEKLGSAKLVFATLVCVTLVPACGPGDDGAAGKTLPAGRLRIVGVPGEIPDDPHDAVWDDVPEVRVPLLLQDVAEPRLTEAGAEFVRLQAVHDGSRIAFRARWADRGTDSLVDVDRSADAFALQFPSRGVDGLPDAMMGEKGKPVAILHWSFALQERLDGKPHGIEALFPNAAIDHYPPDAARDEETRKAMLIRYSPARAAGNPVARERPVSAVSDLLAEGFGTLRPAPMAVSSGRGAHSDGTWTVVVTRPLDLVPDSVTALAPGSSGYLAVAVWDGGSGHSGSLKMRSNWVRLDIEGNRP